MRLRYFAIGFASACLWLTYAHGVPSSPLQPFEPDEHTLLLYHFDGGEGLVAQDSSKYGYDGEVRGARWAKGKFGKALSFDGRDDSVFRMTTEAIRGLKQITVECWFSQDNPTGRQFLLGKDITFHFDIGSGSSTSMSLYNRGSVKNAEGLRHQHLGTALGSVRLGRWHHNAVTYDGHSLSFFFDGVLRYRVPAAKNFALGVPSRGLWVGCYVGTDFWFSGKIDEVRVSDNVRYDPASKLRVGQKIFEMPGRVRIQKKLRKLQKTGLAELQVTLKKLYGGNAEGRVSLKPHGRSAVIVGRYELKGVENGAGVKLEFDVSDEVSGPGTYILGLENAGGHGYFAAIAAVLTSRGRPIAEWAGEVRMRRTFKPPVLVPLQAGNRKASNAPARILLLPNLGDRISGALEIDEVGERPFVFGDGWIEYWLAIPAPQTYRVYLRYAAPFHRPCDIVMDGQDLNEYDMCAVNGTATSSEKDALWEYQGSTTLTEGVHWLRVQGVLPDLYGLRLEPAPPVKQAAIPWARSPVPEGDFLQEASTWAPQTLFGQPKKAAVELDRANGRGALRFSVTFANKDEQNLLAGDAVRLVHSGAWDLEPFGRFQFRFEGQGSGHVVTLWAVDLAGREKLLWRTRDTEAGTRDLRVPVSFEGNSVFDPGRVASVCIDLDEGNFRSAEVDRFAGAILEPLFVRRDLLVPPDGYPVMLSEARRRIKQVPRTKIARLSAPLYQPWTKPVVPEEHPLFSRTNPRPVTRKTLGYEFHCTGARGIAPGTLDNFHKFYDFGDICWPHIGICPQRGRYAEEKAYGKALRNFEKRLLEVRDRGLFLFDIWGYVPYNQRFTSKIAPEHHQILLKVFGDRFLGYDNGEQDGRYIGSYSGRGKQTSRKESWEDFVRWDEHICADSMNYMNATGSLNFSHYYGERNCRLLGLETAQGLPSDTLRFAFLRGAGKQYGRLIYQASSIWNRFGYRVYSGRKTTRIGGYGYGPSKGCSLSLHKRLFFCGYLGGHSIFGTETSQFTADQLENGAPELSPLGRQHLALKTWAEQHPGRGAMATPVAFMMDFYNGWNMPRHLYRSDKYKIWGKFPYEKGDYQADALFRMVWPGYEDCGYWRNERGFITPTPFGDIFDVITNRCRPEILKQYASLVLLGDVEMTEEVVRNLAAYVRAGGDLVVGVPEAKALGPGLAGASFGDKEKGCLSHQLASGRTFEEQPYSYTTIAPGGATSLLINEKGHPIITVNRVEKGRVIVIAADRWMTDRLSYRVPEIVNMEPPYKLLDGVQAVLADYFGSFNPIEINPPGLTVRTCLYEGEPGRLLAGLLNNSLSADWRGGLRVRAGQIASVRGQWKCSPRLEGGRVELKVPAGEVAILDIRLLRRDE